MKFTFKKSTTQFDLVWFKLLSFRTSSKQLPRPSALIAQRLNRWPCGFGNGPRRWGP